MFYKKRCFRSDPEYIYRQDGEYFLGHLVDYPDYVTPHGKSLEELKENLRDYAEKSLLFKCNLVSLLFTPLGTKSTESYRSLEFYNPSSFACTPG